MRFSNILGGQRGDRPTASVSDSGGLTVDTDDEELTKTWSTIPTMANANGLGQQPGRPANSEDQPLRFPMAGTAKTVPVASTHIPTPTHTSARPPLRSISPDAVDVPAAKKLVRRAASSPDDVLSRVSLTPFLFGSLATLTASLTVLVVLLTRPVLSPTTYWFFWCSSAILGMSLYGVGLFSRSKWRHLLQEVGMSLTGSPAVPGLLLLLLTRTGG